MTQRQLLEEEFERDVEDVRRELTAKLAFLNNRVIGSKLALPERVSGFESYVVSPLNRRLQKHLIDWRTLERKDLRLIYYLERNKERKR